MSLTCRVIYSHFVDSVNFCCHAQASQLFEPTHASSSNLVVTKPTAGGVYVSSSDTEDLLNLLFLSPACDSPSAHRRASSDTDSFKSCTEVNDMAMSVYVALSADALSSHKPTIDAPDDNRKCRFSDSSTREMKKTPRCKAAPSNAPRKKSKRIKIHIDRALAAPIARDGSLSATGFDRSEWEIMYSPFVAEGLVDTSACVNRKDT
jgi:hypothetical protein